jgi:hypothetical protein
MRVVHRLTAGGGKIAQEIFEELGASDAAKAGGGGETEFLDRIKRKDRISGEGAREGGCWRPDLSLSSFS